MVSYVKVHVYCVFNYFLFNAVSTLDGELSENVYCENSLTHNKHVTCTNSQAELRELHDYCVSNMQFHVTHHCWSGDKIEEKIVKHTINMHFHVTHRLKWRQDWRENSQTHNKHTLA